MTIHHQDAGVTDAPRAMNDLLSKRIVRVGITAAGLLGCVVAANVATSHWGMVPVGFGLIATAGTYFAGATFVLRDLLQDQAGKLAVIVALALGAALSFLLAAPAIATASTAAFLIAELADLLVYTPLRKHGYIRAAVASNVVGSAVDTIVFLTLAGFPLAALPGQMIGKLAVTIVVIAGVTTIALLRQPLHADGGNRHA